MRPTLLVVALIVGSCAAVPDRPAAPRADGAPDGAPATLQEPPPAPAEEGLRVLSFHVGLRSFDEEDWAPVEDQGAFAIDFAMQSPGAVVGFECGLEVSAAQEDVLLFDGNAYHDVSVESSFFELYGGVHMSFAASPAIRPYLGAGLVLQSYALDVHGDLSGSDDDTSPGLYAHTGVAVRLARQIELGLDLRGVFGTDYGSSSLSFDGDYTQATFFLGVRF